MGLSINGDGIFKCQTLGFSKQHWGFYDLINQIRHIAPLICSEWGIHIPPSYDNPNAENGISVLRRMQNGIGPEFQDPAN